MAVQSLPSTLDINPFDGTSTKQVAALMNSWLFNYDTTCATTPSVDKLAPQLAKSWKVSADRKSIQITLNSLKSQYGNALTSADVKWSLQRAQALSGIAKFLSTGDAHYAKVPITVTSPAEFTLNLTAPTPDDLALFTVPTFSIFDSTEAKKHATTADPWANKWVQANSDGFGPWKVDSFDKGNQIVMSKNPGWTGASGNISKVIVKQIADPAQQAQLLGAGSVNYSGQLTWSQYQSLAGNSKVTVYKCASFSRDVLVLQQKDPKFAKPLVKQAIASALVRSDLNKGAYAGFATPAVTGWNPATIPQGATVEKYTEDVAKAKQLLSQAGYPNGFSFTLSYNDTQPGPQVEQDAILIKSQLAKVGITVNLKKLASAADFTTAQFSGKFEAIISSEGPAVPSTYFDASFFSPTSPINTFGYNNKKFNADLAAIASSAPGSAMYNKAIVDSANINITDGGWIYLVATPNIFAMSSSVTGLDKAMGTGLVIPQPSALSVG